MFGVVISWRCAAVLALVATLPGAAAAERFEAEYVLSVGGLEVGRFETRLSEEGEAYRLAYAAETTGLIGFLFPFTSSGSSEGVLADLGPKPTRFAGQSRRPDGRSRWAVDFGPEGEVVGLDVEVPEEEDREPVPPQFRRGPDPLALALRATGDVAPGVEIEGTSFDGKRAFRYQFACAGAEQVAATSRASLPSGNVLECFLDGELEGGRSRRFGDGRDDDRSPARIFLSPELVPGRYWPVRVEAKTSFGTAVVRLTEYR